MNGDTVKWVARMSGGNRARRVVACESRSNNEWRRYSEVRQGDAIVWDVGNDDRFLNQTTTKRYGYLIWVSETSERKCGTLLFEAETTWEREMCGYQNFSPVSGRKKKQVGEAKTKMERVTWWRC